MKEIAMDERKARNCVLLWVLGLALAAASVITADVIHRGVCLPVLLGFAAVVLIVNVPLYAIEVEIDEAIREIRKEIRENKKSG